MDFVFSITVTIGLNLFEEKDGTAFHCYVEIIRQLKLSGSDIEFAVQMGGEKCADKVREALKGMGELEIDSKQGRVIIHTQEPWFVIKEKIRETGSHSCT
ncbi:hypothetical protein DOY81_012766 [Sarcophaga bullata]|nr:hypothetical protein DOY81_012766 [Sarcophaga bullata]